MEIKQVIADKGSLIFWLLIGLGTAFFLINDFHSDFWFDEAYSIRMVQHSFGEIWNVAGLDVHPPLYYYMLKLYSLITGESIVAYRIFSTLGLVSTMILGGVLSKRLFGLKTALLFVILLILTPLNQYVASEIRMYAWVMFFCLGGGIFAYKAYQDEKTKDWVILVAFTIVSFYCHYYGAITMIIVFTILLVFSLLYKKKFVKHILLCTLAVTLLYLPWLANLFYQINEVNSEYWISPIGFFDVFTYLTIPFDLKASWPHNQKTMTVTSLIVLSVINIYILCWISIRKQEKEARTFRIAILFLSVHLLLMLAGIGISLALRPVFISRYLICSLPFLLMSLAIVLSLIDTKPIANKILLIGFSALLVLAFSFRFYATYEVNKLNVRIQNSIQTYLKENMGANDAFLSPTRLHFTIGIYSLLYPDKPFYYLTKSYGKFMDNFEFIQIENYEQIDPKHAHLFIINPDPSSDYIYDMNREELESYFVIEKFVTSTGNSIYKLTPRNK